VTGSVELTKSELVVVLVVKNVEQIAQEWVKVLVVSVLALAWYEVGKRTSRMGNSETIRPIFSSNVSWVNLTFRM
jgi:hypothetical protein